VRDGKRPWLAFPCGGRLRHAILHDCASRACHSDADAGRSTDTSVNDKSGGLRNDILVCASAISE